MLAVKYFYMFVLVNMVDRSVMVTFIPKQR